MANEYDAFVMITLINDGRYGELVEMMAAAGGVNAAHASCIYKIGEHEFKINPLAYAVYKKDLEALKIFKAGGADLNKMDFGGLMFGKYIENSNTVASIIECGTPEILTYLKEQGMTFGIGINKQGEVINPLCDVIANAFIMSKDSDELNANIAAYIDLGGDFMTPDRNGETPFEMAIDCMNARVFDKIVEVGGKHLLTARTGNGFTPLGRSIQNNLSSMFNHLISKNLPIGDVVWTGESAVDLAKNFYEHRVKNNHAKDLQDEALEIFNTVSKLYKDIGKSAAKIETTAVSDETINTSRRRNRNFFEVTK